MTNSHIHFKETPEEVEERLMRDPLYRAVRERQEAFRKVQLALNSAALWSEARSEIIDAVMDYGIAALNHGATLIRLHGVKDSQ